MEGTAAAVMIAPLWQHRRRGAVVKRHGRPAPDSQPWCVAPNARFGARPYAGASLIFVCMVMSAVTQRRSWNVSFRWLQRRVGAQVRPWGGGERRWGRWRDGTDAWGPLMQPPAHQLTRGSDTTLPPPAHGMAAHGVNSLHAPRNLVWWCGMHLVWRASSLTVPLATHAVHVRTHIRTQPSTPAVRHPVVPRHLQPDVLSRRRQMGHALLAGDDGPVGQEAKGRRAHIRQRRRIGSGRQGGAVPTEYDSTRSSRRWRDVFAGAHATRWRCWRGCGPGALPRLQPEAAAGAAEWVAGSGRAYKGAACFANRILLRGTTWLDVRCGGVGR